jgi:hypothetical protein
MTSSITTDDLYAFVGRNVVGNNLTVEVNNSMGGTIDTGGNITLNAGGNLTVNGSGGLAFTIQNTTGTINNGGNIGLMVGGSISTPGALSLLVENYDFSGNTPGHIGRVEIFPLRREEISPRNRSSRLSIIAVAAKLIRRLVLV